MLSRVKSILSKNKNQQPQNIYAKYFSKSEDTILLNDLVIRFDTQKEDRKYVEIGNKGLIKAEFIFESEKGYVNIGNNVHIGGAMFISRNSITVKDDVTMAWGITIYDHDSHSIFWDKRKNDNHQCYKDFKEFRNNVMRKDWSNVISKPIVIESKAWIGFDVTILKGVTIGEGSVIGAKSVVTKNIPAWTVAAGNPARVIRQLEKPE